MILRETQQQARIHILEHFWQNVSYILTCGSFCGIFENQRASALATAAEEYISDSNMLQEKKEPHECTRLLSAKSQPFSAPRSLNCLEFIPGKPSRRFAMQVPPGKLGGSILRLSLGSGECSVQLPSDAVAGETLIIIVPI